MTGAELVKRFLDFSQSGGTFPLLEPGDATATLYGLDECIADVQGKSVTLPDFGKVPCPTLDRVEGAAWFATINHPGKGVSFAIGLGDPYTPGPANPLPTKQGVIAAVPYRFVNAAAEHDKKGGAKRRP